MIYVKSSIHLKRKKAPELLDLVVPIFFLSVCDVNVYFIK